MNDIPSVTWNHPGVTILWAPRSPCDLGCKYCYFGTVEGNRDLAIAPRTGALSHLGQYDLSLEIVLGFIESFTSKMVHRVFIAGGEPLNWAGTRPMVSALKGKNIQVIICTNGLSLSDEETFSWLIDSGIEALSVSLDSYDANYNDYWRRDPTGRGWQEIVRGIKTFIKKRNEIGSHTKVGIYAVITRLNIDHILETALFAGDLGMDYFIIQPVSLAKEHKLHDELSLDGRHYGAFSKTIDLLMKSGVKTRLPNDLYLKLILHTIADRKTSLRVRGCFGGRDLFFIEPDGSVWDCPSMYKIAETRPDRFFSIKGRIAADIFSSARFLRDTDCACFSEDCVNMWQLMAFDEIIGS